MMGFDQWWEEFESVHPDWRYADSDALRKAAWEAGVDSEIVKRWEGNCIASEEAREQLAASQAREKALRDALIELRYAHTSKAYTMTEKALAQPTEDTALKAALAAERERCAKVCEETSARLDIEHGYNASIKFASGQCIKAIQELGD